MTAAGPTPRWAAPVEHDEAMALGFLSLPNGLGLDYPGDDGDSVVTGVAPNELTSSEDRDLAGRHAPPQARAGPPRAGLKRRTGFTTGRAPIARTTDRLRVRVRR